ncbi:MAG: hypothetical protein U5Q16_06580 [Gammaproteobacteria bacterium]|nr:hypothetical protein [Gammaproteobacteria bacterium]
MNVLSAQCCRGGLAAGVVVLAACTSVGVDPSKLEIVEDVDPLPRIHVQRVCVEVNTGVKQSFTDGLFEALRELEFATASKQTAFGDECRFWMRYSATWTGFPEYLATAHFDVYEDRSRIGRAVYDATGGGSRLDRYGSATEKVKPMLNALFLRVERGEAPGG